MDWSTIVGVLSAIGTAIVGGYVSANRADIKEVQRDLNDHKVRSAEKYVTADDLKEIKESLHRIEALMHTKADK